MPSFEGQIIDCHFHPAFDAGTDSSWFRPAGGVQQQIDALRRAGIAQACGAAIRQGHPSSFDEIRSLNDQVLALRDRFPDFYIPGVQVHHISRTSRAGSSSDAAGGRACDGSANWSVT